jgi:hypothetical protein
MFRLLDGYDTVLGLSETDGSISHCSICAVEPHPLSCLTPQYHAQSENAFQIPNVSKQKEM